MHLQFSETNQHEANHCQVDHGFTGQSLAFVIPTESAGTPEPAESTLHYPAPRQHLEGMQIGALYDFDRAAPQLARALQQPSSIASVGPDVFDLSASPLTEESSQQLLGSIAVLDVGWQDYHLEQQADGVD